MINHHGSPPTFVGDRGQLSWIDIIAVLPALLAQIADWRVDTSKEVASDHRLLLTQVRGQPQRVVVWQWPNWHAVDWVTLVNNYNGSYSVGLALLHARDVPCSNGCNGS